MPKRLLALDQPIGLHDRPTWTGDQLAWLAAIAIPGPDPIAWAQDPANHPYDACAVTRLVELRIAALVERYGRSALDMVNPDDVLPGHRKLVAYTYGFAHELDYCEPQRELTRDVLQACLRHLFVTDHSDNQTETHHGRNFTANRYRSYCAIPGTYNGGPGILVEAHGWDCDGIAPGELDRVAEILHELGQPTAETWNGKPGTENGGIRLAGRLASDSLLAAVKRGGDRWQAANELASARRAEEATRAQMLAQARAARQRNRTSARGDVLAAGEARRTAERRAALSREIAAHALDESDDPAVRAAARHLIKEHQ